MKSFTLSISLLLTFTLAFCQQNHFVYVQTDNKQSFYIKVNDKLYSSSAAGYTIVPKLLKGDYKFLIGFPKNEFAQQSITVSVSGDAGYMLKNFGEKGWGLYNMQTMNVDMASNGVGAAIPAGQTKSNDFSNTLAEVVNTPSIKKEDAFIPVVTASEIVTKTETNPSLPLKASPAIKILSSILDNSGRAMIFNDGGDTVTLFIPYEKSAIAAIPEVIKPLKKEISEPVEKDSKFLNIELENPNAKADVKADASNSVTPVPEIKTVDSMDGSAESKPITSPAVKELKPLMINSDCKSIATDDDFLKIRKKMASEDTDDAMVAAAKKMFRLKCYSTDQIKNLSVLFLKDSGKYAFFDASYPFISDTNNFSKLEAQLSDQYYITRFKAMLRN